MEIIDLISYDEQNDKHIKLIKKIQSDEEIQKNVNSLPYINKNSFVIKLDNFEIGLIKLIEEQGNCVSIDIGILSKYKNCKIGTLAVNKILYKIFCENKYRKIILRTSKKDNHIEEIAKSCDFCLDYEEIEKGIEEGVTFNVYSTVNTYFVSVSDEVKQTKKYSI